MTAVEMPAALARSKPKAWALLETMRRRSSGSRSARQASMTACRLEPPPEMKTAVGTRSGKDDRRTARMARFDLADDRGVLRFGIRNRMLRDGKPNGIQRALPVCRGDDHAKANAHVEHAVAFLAVEMSALDEQRGQRRNRPGARVQPCGEMLGNRTREIFEQTAARDVRHTLDLHACMLHGADVR